LSRAREMSLNGNRPTLSGLHPGQNITLKKNEGGHRCRERDGGGRGGAASQGFGLRGRRTLLGEVDGRFPNHFPDPTIPGNLKDLIERVKKTRAMWEWDMMATGIASEWWMSRAISSGVIN